MLSIQRTARLRFGVGCLVSPKRLTQESGPDFFWGFLLFLRGFDALFVYMGIRRGVARAKERWRPPPGGFKRPGSPGMGEGAA